MNPKIYFYYLIIILISFSCNNSPTGGDDGNTTTGGEDGTTTTGGDDCGQCPLSLSIGNINNGLIEILLMTPQDIAGFQFDVVGAAISGGSGGLAGDANFSISALNGETVLGFSFSGSIIPGGSSGVLTNLEYTELNTEYCLDGIVLSNPAGEAIQHNLSDCD